MLLAPGATLPGIEEPFAVFNSSLSYCGTHTLVERKSEHSGDFMERKCVKKRRPTSTARRPVCCRVDARAHPLAGQAARGKGSSRGFYFSEGNAEAQWRQTEGGARRNEQSSATPGGSDGGGRESPLWRGLSTKRLTADSSIRARIAPSWIMRKW